MDIFIYSNSSNCILFLCIFLCVNIHKYIKLLLKSKQLARKETREETFSNISRDKARYIYHTRNTKDIFCVQIPFNQIAFGN